MRYALLSFIMLLCLPLLAQRPSRTPCCQHAPNRPGHVNKELANGKATSPNVSNLEVVQSETRVEMVGDSLYRLHAAIRIGNGGNVCVDSTEAYAIVTLPQFGIVRSAMATSATGKALEVVQCKAQIHVKLSYLCPSSGKDVITVTVARAPRGSGADCQPSFSVYAYSSKPDNDPSNNYWWWRRQCGTGPNDFTPLDPTWGPR